MVRSNRPSHRLGIGPLLVLLLVLPTAFGQGYEQRYRDQGDGTVLATQSGLLWLARANCWGPMPWEEAQAAAARLQEGMCGLTDGSKPGDWRLPTEKEWRAMVECSCGEIALTDDQGTGCYASGTSTFHGVQPMDYWSSTESSRGEGKVRVMSLHDALDSAMAAEASLPVWPVRRASASKPLKDDGG